ncbi:MAG: MAPEG family protein [Roseibium sp.]|uniref:MAPEG family protein n=1 Tax=Roseibium sp. TaxID=1936156 RepID=UPI001B2D0236|nr:MAPEG family protein [Roseibium sp.]MBO6508894.1 MAPEG family protein [Roseibium sp.]MBO6890439.1 MAPEG family protein [Roseibium sp.]MBO6931673.1 MAPEG family protein [Roseibium sp.]
MSIVVTPFFTALLAALYMILTVRVINARGSERIGLGEQGNEKLLRRVRAHSNCAEYVPIALLLILMLELMGAAPWLLVGLGTVLLAGRSLHAYGFSHEPELGNLRVAGMILTFTVIGIATIANLILSLDGLFLA